MNVGWIENGDYIKVKGVAFGAGATRSPRASRRPPPVAG
jgi:hypothetical protein